MRKIIGIAIILCSILLAITFNYVGWYWLIEGIGLTWQHFFKITCIAGAAVCMVPKRKRQISD